MFLKYKNIIFGTLLGIVISCSARIPKEEKENGPIMVNSIPQDRRLITFRETMYPEPYGLRYPKKYYPPYQGYTLPEERAAQMRRPLSTAALHQRNLSRFDFGDTAYQGPIFEREYSVKKPWWKFWNNK